ncbi:hypothetical protein PG990_009985 [Apiospora arundinis]
MSVVETYKHEPLGSRDAIRVFDLLPAISPRAPVEVRLREVSLTTSDVKVQYEALSYVWGDATQGKSILFAGKRLGVTDNCHDALVHLRRKMRSRTLWVDAICIDQVENETSTKERNLQVQKMGQIYHSASRVIIWLGPANKSMRLLFRAIKLWSISAKAEKFSARTTSTLVEMISGITTLLLFRIYPKRNRVQPGLSDLSRNPWFLRVWTVQETALARAATIMTSRLEMNWKTFMAVLHGIDLGYPQSTSRLFVDSVFLRFQAATVTESLDVSFPSNEDDEVAWRSMRRKRERYRTPNHELQRNLLRCLPYFQCMRGVDKVYGMYTIARNWGYNLSAPSYDRPVEEVFQEFVKAFIQIHGDLMPLTTTLPANTSTGLPSWLPDWLTVRPTVLDEDVDVSGVFTPLKAPDWCASAWSAADASWDLERRGLTLRGKHIGSVVSKICGSPKGQYDDPESGEFDDFVQACQQWIQTLDLSTLDRFVPSNPDLFDDQPSWSALEQHILLLPWGPARPQRIGEIFRSVLETSMFMPTRHGGFVDWVHMTLYPDPDRALAVLGKIPVGPAKGKGGNRKRRVPKYHQGVSRSPEDMQANFAKMQRHVNQFANYAFVTLDNGMWTRAHLSCQIGDEVWLLAGSDVPVMLRQQEGNNRFRIVAPAFVYGIMQGEMWPKDESTLKTITLV